MTGKCKALKKNGTECAADAQVGSDVCVFHDPTKTAEVHRARRAGGLRRSRPAAVLPRQTPDHPLRNTTEVSAFLAKSINQVLRGALDPRVVTLSGKQMHWDEPLDRAFAASSARTMRLTRVCVIREGNPFLASSEESVGKSGR